ncbi:sugar nucleotide-binding protein, partial [Alphaproteobacteria bacterium]|nr:sugar nucleotide-binding protein [Alphaproteobacteria bacterium]
IFPHNLNEVCDLYNVRLIHISTDCIFSGKKGQYENYDNSDSDDLYGKSKALGEIDNTKALTIRTSTIGHELSTSHGLLEWFLSQTKECRGYKNAIFSGLTNIELSRVIINYIIPDKTITGIYNIGGKAIDKFSLLAILNKYYKKNVKIKPDYNFIINRSLNSSIFYKKTGYNPPDWEKQVEEMYKSNVARKI